MDSDSRWSQSFAMRVLATDNSEYATVRSRVWPEVVGASLRLRPPGRIKSQTRYIKLYSNTIFTTNIASAVGICALITAYLSGNSSKAAGMRL